MSESLQVSNLRKSFGKLKAVDDVSFSINRGEIFGFLGPNGAGKTTVINLITRKLKKDSGEIRFNGKSLEENPGILQEVGVCTQELQLWPLLTCQEQLHFMGQMYGLKSREIKERADYLLEVVELKEKRKVISKNLSGGMQRRLHLAMALMHDPEFIILDEPEAGLDPQSRILVREFIKSLSGSKTVLLTTHNMDEAERLSTRVAIIDRGNIMEVGPPDVLRRKIAPEEALEIVYEKTVDLTGMELGGDNYSFRCQDGTITVVGSDLIKHLPEIMDKVIAKAGIPVNFNFRQSSLEDVFIKLTGRSLRQ